jgi:hypothetical protein
MACSRLLGHLLFAVVLSGAALQSRVAHALPPGGSASSIHIVGLDSEDADEQADALTSALRAKVRGMPTYALGEPNQQLSILMTALKCKGTQPDTACEQSIGKQLNSKRFVWGQVVHNKAAANVTVTVHLRGSEVSKPTNATETYPDISKDVQSVATRLLAGLLGNATAGLAKVTVRSTESDCGVSIDGARAGQLTRGEGVFDVAAGEHTFAVLPPCKAAQVSKAIAGTEGIIDLSPVAATKLTDPASGASAKESGKSSLRPIVGWSLIGVAAASAAIGTYGFVTYYGAKNEGQKINDEKPFPSDPIGLGSNICTGNKISGSDRVKRFCEQHDRAINNSILGGVALGIGGAALIGGIILLTGGKSDDKAARVQVTPLLGGVQGAAFSGSF